MKKLLLFVLGVMVVCIGCNEEKEEDIYLEQEVDEPLYWAFASKDSVHQYGIVEDYKTGSTFLCKENKKDGSDIWKMPLTQPDPLMINLGYGKIEPFEYQVFSIIDTDNNILVYWNIKFKNYASINTKGIPIYQTYVSKCTLSGEFIECIPIGIQNVALGDIREGNGRLVGMNNECFLVIQGGLDKEEYEWGISCCYYITVDINTNTILEIYKEEANAENKELYFPLNSFNSIIQFVNNHIVFIYEGGNIQRVCDWNKKKQILDIESFVNQKYPNEEHAPQYSTSHEVITETYADFTLHITFYNGAKVEHRLRFDYEAQEIIELML